MPSTILVALCITALIRQPLPAQNGTEHRVVAAVDEGAAGALELLQEIVNINSGTMNFAGVRRVGAVLRARFDALGFDTEWIDGAPFDRAGHLLATHDGPGPRLLLIGHLDTVFEPDHPFQAWEWTSDSTARGPGVVDMKGGDVVIVLALEALARAAVLDGLNIAVVMTGDEEDSGTPLDLARASLIEAADAADVALAFENGDSDPTTAVIARRGSTTWRLSVTGRPAHSSQVFQPEVGAGAIYEASRILFAFYDELSGEPLLTFNPGVILGGTDVDFDIDQARGTAFGKDNVVAEHAMVSGDLRAVSPEQLANAKLAMRRIADGHLPLTTADLEFHDSYPPFAPTDGNRRLLALFDAVSRGLGFGAVTAVDPRKAGAADVSFTMGRVAMALDGLGTGGGNDHTADEWIDVRTLAMQAKRAAVLMLRLAAGQ
ncbi:MAG TPA: M20/M25/M40 family metallo-hydrolase [Gemmatimonadales bacterium]|jgi:glutamate carboxypeptidase